jgi:hypothetical protein
LADERRRGCENSAGSRIVSFLHPNPNIPFYGYPYPPQIDRTQRLLAHLLRWRSGRHDRAPRWRADDSNPWGWSCGFCPSMEQEEPQDGTAATFDAAKVDFEQVWHEIVPGILEEAFQEWCDQRAMTAWKYEMHDRGLPLPTQMADGQSLCFCGIEISVRNVHKHFLRQHAYQDRS